MVAHPAMMQMPMARNMIIILFISLRIEYHPYEKKSLDDKRAGLSGEARTMAIQGTKSYVVKG